MTIKIFTTGGSIDKRYSTQESCFVIGPPVVGRLLREAHVTVDFDIEPLLRKDSLDITDADRRLIASSVQQDPHQLILITHGTDTMVDTAQPLSRCQGKTIVLTGSMQPAACVESDAPFNVAAAFLAVQILPPGVYLVMNGQIFDPARTTKNVPLDRFEST